MNLGADVLNLAAEFNDGELEVHTPKSAGAGPNGGAAIPAPSTIRMPEDDMRLAARVYVPVLVTSENRGRRDICARLIHAYSDRWRGPFVTFSCTGNQAIVADSSVSPGAHDRTDDLMLRHQFDQARGGTLFIDDLAALTSEAQEQLLSLLEECVRPDSSTVELAGPSPRIIAGASRHLHLESATGAFCESLLYRLNIIHVDLTKANADERP